MSLYDVEESILTRMLVKPYPVRDDDMPMTAEREI